MTAAQWVGLGLQISIMLMVLALGLTATWQDVTNILRRPKLLLRAVLAMNVITPIVAAVLAWLFAERLEVQASLVALAVSPVPPIIFKKQLSVGATREYVIGLLMAMSVIAIVLVPLTIRILDLVFGRSAMLPPIDVAKIVLKTVLVPLGIGLLIHHFFPKSEKASGVIVAIGGLLLGGGALVLIYSIWPLVWDSVGNGLVLGLVLLAVIGLAVGHLLGGPIPGNRTALALTTASTSGRRTRDCDFRRTHGSKTRTRNYSAVPSRGYGRFHPLHNVAQTPVVGITSPRKPSHFERLNKNQDVMAALRWLETRSTSGSAATLAVSLWLTARYYL